MNVIINGFHDPVIQPLVPRLIDNLSIDYGEIITREDIVGFSSQHKNIQFHYHKNLTHANYPVDKEQLAPLDEKIILGMLDYEAVVIKMFDRLEKYIGSLSYTKRKNLYLKHLRYWNHILEKKNIKLFLSSNIPHEIYDFVIYALCRKKNIRTILLHQSLPDFVFILEDWERFMPEIQETYLKLLADPETDPKNIKLSEKAEKLWIAQTSGDEDPVPVYMKKRSWNSQLLKKIEGLHRNIKKFINPNNLNRLFRGENWQIFYRKYGLRIKKMVPSVRLNNYYKKYAIKPDLTAKYIYFPLHFQPELTTSPIAGVFVDQLLIVEMLSSCTPDNIFIYIKENPKQRHWGRNIEFYKDLIRMKKVRLIPKKTNSFRLIENAIAVATATGTVGWEALFRGKPVLMFGHFYYQYAHGVFQIKNMQDCKDAFNNILSRNGIPSLYSTRLYLAAMDKHCISGNYHSIFQQASICTLKESQDNIYKALINKITKT